MATTSDDLICPACQSENVHRARARGLDHLVKLIGSQPFRCEDCGERFRSTSMPRAGAGIDIPISEPAQAVCPNCEEETTVRLTAGERELAVDEGWVISCPHCRALFPFVKPL